jgi:UDP-glucose 4-epimerase
MEKYAVRNIVFSSSATVYDATNISPLKETDLL